MEPADFKQTRNRAVSVSFRPDLSRVEPTNRNPMFSLLLDAVEPDYKGEELQGIQHLRQNLWWGSGQSLNVARNLSRFLVSVASQCRWIGRIPATSKRTRCIASNEVF